MLVHLKYSGQMHLGTQKIHVNFRRRNEYKKVLGVSMQTQKFSCVDTHQMARMNGNHCLSAPNILSKQETAVNLPQKHNSDFVGLYATICNQSCGPCALCNVFHYMCTLGAPVPMFCCIYILLTLLLKLQVSLTRNVV